MWGVIPAPTDPNRRPRPPQPHHRPKHAPGRWLGKYPIIRPRPKHPRRRTYIGLLARIHLRDDAPWEDVLIRRPDPLQRDCLIGNPEWRALLRRIIEGKGSR